MFAFDLHTRALNALVEQLAKDLSEGDSELRDILVGVGLHPASQAAYLAAVAVLVAHDVARDADTVDGDGPKALKSVKPSGSGKSLVGLQVCPRCQRSFSTAKFLARHLQREHGAIAPSVS